MRRIRFTIGSLLVVVLFTAVGIAALRESTDVWDNAVFGGTLAMLMLAILLAVHRMERRRAFWLGFSLFGAIYLAASLVPAIESRLLTTQALVKIDEMVPRPKSFAITFTTTGGTTGPSTSLDKLQAVAFSADGSTLAAQSNGKFRLWSLGNGRFLRSSNGSSENFKTIGHSLFALLIAFAGGHLSRFLHARNRAETSPDATSEPSTPPDLSSGGSHWKS